MSHESAWNREVVPDSYQSQNSEISTAVSAAAAQASSTHSNLNHGRVVNTDEPSAFYSAKTEPKMSHKDRSKSDTSSTIPESHPSQAPTQRMSQGSNSNGVETIDLTQDEEPPWPPAKKAPATPTKPRQNWGLPTPAITNGSTNDALGRKRIRPDSESPTPIEKKQKPFEAPPSLKPTPAANRPVFRPPKSIDHVLADLFPAADRQPWHPVDEDETAVSPVYKRRVVTPQDQHPVGAVNGNTNGHLANGLPLGDETRKAPQRPQPSPAVDRSKVTQQNGIVCRDPSRFSIKPEKWARWTGAEYLALSERVEKSFDAVAFAAASGKPLEEVQHVFRAVVTRPLRLARENAKRGEEGMAEMARYFKEFGTPIRTWCSEMSMAGRVVAKDWQWKVRGELMGIEGDHVLVAMEEGQKAYPKMKRPGVAMVPRGPVVMCGKDMRYLAGELGEQDRKVLAVWREEVTAEMRKRVEKRTELEAEDDG